MVYLDSNSTMKQAMPFQWKNYLFFTLLIGFFCSILLTANSNLFWNAAALGVLMIVCWVFELIPIYVTALFPLIFAIPLKLISPHDLASSYGNNNVFLFFGGFILALALEKWKVHEQIARTIIHILGNSVERILLGFTASTFLLSMWISNTATSLMMLPMALAVIHAMPKKEQKQKFPLLLVLTIAYSSSIGGMATLVGSPPNTQMAALLDKNFDAAVTFWDWFKFGFPISLGIAVCMYLFFLIILGKERKDKHHFDLKKEPWTKNQIKVLVVFGIVILGWIFRVPITEFTGFKYGDEGIALLGAISLFLLPSKQESKPLLEWKDTEKLPWGILLLFGGGLALATIFENNGIMQSINAILASYSGLSILSILFIVVFIGIFVTEIMSNLALVTIMVPVVGNFSISLGLPPEYLCIPLTLAASCAFMLPVGTPPNAIVFSSGFIKIHEMAKIGFILNIFAIILITFFYFIVKVV
jgi:sodium-dependent dicarboxylate transporter 2/3/5